MWKIPSYGGLASCMLFFQSCLVLPAALCLNIFKILYEHPTSTHLGLSPKLQHILHSNAIFISKSKAKGFIINKGKGTHSYIIVMNDSAHCTHMIVFNLLHGMYHTNEANKAICLNSKSTSRSFFLDHYQCICLNHKRLSLTALSVCLYIYTFILIPW